MTTRKAIDAAKASMTETIIDGDVRRLHNRAAEADQAGASGTVALSVLIPFYGADPSELLRAVAAQAVQMAGAVEIVCADDASPDASIAAAVAETVADLPVACTLLLAGRNRGRSLIRNLLAEQARGGHLLYLDGDMAVAQPDFLASYLTLIRNGEVGIAFGGFDMGLEADDDPAHDLHVWSSRRDHCLPAAVRQRNPEKYTYTSNLLVRRDLMLACPFSDAFHGWGWEDVDWAMRAAKLSPILQIDNPAVHRGFSPAEVLLRKYRESVPNFRVLHARHRDAVERLPLFKASRIAARLPFPEIILRLLRWMVTDRHRILPMRQRDLALKLYRAWLYRDVARQSGGST